MTQYNLIIYNFIGTSCSLNAPGKCDELLMAVAREHLLKGKAQYS